MAMARAAKEAIMKRWLISLSWTASALLGSVSLAGCGPAADASFDVLIENAKIVDGTGNPWFRADIGIRDGRVAEVGPLGGRAAARTIDAQDRVVSPGFIDMMGQSTLVLVQDRVTAESRLRQGITTTFSGEGWSHAPQNERTQPEPVEVNDREVSWTTYDEYFRLLEEEGVALNVVHNVGAAQVRRMVLGEEDVQPTPEEMEEMRRLVEEAMRQGAVGLTTALIYPPGAYAPTEEIIELARVVARYGGVYYTHIRNEGNLLLEALDDAFRVGDEAGLPVHIFHLKAAGEENWPLMEQAIAKMDAARARGLDVTADIYPYIRNGIGLRSFLPPRVYGEGQDAFLASLEDPRVRASLREELETTSDWENWYRHVGFDWDRVLITGARRYEDPEIAGLSVAEAAERAGKDVWDMFFELAASGVSTAPESMNEEQKHQALRAPWVMIDTDTQPINPARVTSTHPRAFGAFPRVMAKYVRQDSILSLEEAVKRMTSLPANRLGLRDRGRISPGMAADLVIFDPERITDRATFTDPLQYSEGVDYLLINGEVVIDDEVLLTHVLL
jgi:N-acyl-D-amino-acid deacylase